MRPPIGLGDVVRAWDALGRDAAHVPTLLRVLGLEASIEAPGEADVSTGEGSPGRHDDQPPPRRREGAREPVPADPRPALTGDTRAHVDHGASGLRPVTLRPLPQRPPATPAWSTVDRLADPVAAGPPQPPAPLFEPRRERALVAAAARTLRYEGAIDIAAVVAALAAQRPITALPRRRVQSLRGGLQLLVDRTPWMAPFAADVDMIRRRIAGVAGAAVEVVLVRADRQGVTRLPATWVPRAGVQVLAITDLGRAAHRAGRPAPAVLWDDVAQRVRAAGGVLTVIVPGSRAAHEAVIPAGAVVVPWDRATRVGRVARRARGGPR